MPRLGSSRTRDSSVTRDQVLGGGIERKPCFAQQRLQDAPGSGARRRRDRSGGAAAVRRRPRWKLGIADAHRDILGAKPENFGDGLRQDGSGAGADVLHAREHFDRAVAHHAHLTGRINLHIGHPQRLRYAKAAFHGTRIRARGMPAPPADAFGPDAPLFTPHRTRIDALAQDQRVNGKPFGQFVDRLLESESAGRVARCAHRTARPGIDEHVVLCALEIRTVIKRLGVEADAGAKRNTRRAVALQRDCRQRAVALGADAQSLPGARTVARVHLFFFPVEHEANRRLSAAGQLDGEAAVIAERRLGAKAAAHGMDDDPDAIERQAELLRQLVAHAGGVLRGDVDRQPVRAPIGNDAVRFQAAMGLHRGAIFGFDDDIGFAKTLTHVAAAADGRSTHIAVERQIYSCGPARGMAARRGFRAFVNRGRRLRARPVHIDDKG